MQGLDEELRGLTLRRMLYCIVAFGTPLLAMFGFCATYAINGIADSMTSPALQFRMAIGGALAFAAITPLGALALAHYMTAFVTHSNAVAAAQRAGDDEGVAKARTRAEDAAAAITKRMRRDLLKWGLPLGAAFGFAGSYGYAWLFDQRLAAGEQFESAVYGTIAALFSVLVAYLYMVVLDRLHAGYVLYRDSRRV